MKTKKDIQLGLLQEIDEICSKNNLHYILTGLNSLNAYINHTLKNGPLSVAIAMTQGDIDNFCNIIEEEFDESRYVEGIFNNPKYLKSYITYGNKNTTDFNIVKEDNNIHHGINIQIYPIKKINANSSNNLINKILNKAYRASKGKVFKKTMFIDKWEDIQKDPSVEIINKSYKSEIFKELERHEADGLEFYLPKDTDSYFKKMYGKNYKTKEIQAKAEGENVLIDTDFGYEEVFEELKDLIDEARANDKEIQTERKKVKDEYKTVTKVWDLVLMTNKQVEYKHSFENKIGELSNLDLGNEKEFNDVYNELKPVISTLNKYSKKDMTFSINPQTDALIEKVLMKKNRPLLNKIKELNKKEYFIE